LLAGDPVRRARAQRVGPFAALPALRPVMGDAPG
jgi:hypothetical protein